MPRTFTTRDARRLISKFKRLQSKLDDSLQLVRSYRTLISTAAQKLVAKETLKELNNIPIEEINRDKRGFRIKALRDAGYNTIDDIADATVGNIASIHGISADMAYSIHRIVQEFVDKTGKNTKVRLSTDNRNPENKELILFVSKYRKVLHMLKRIER